LKIFNPEPWLVVGDFNEILSQDEKSGALVRREGQMDLFREALEECYLSDLGYKGPKYTWNNCRQSDNFTKERLDRAMANRSWCAVFKMVEVRVLAGRSSDHKPIIVQLDGGKGVRVGYNRRFKVEASWMLDDEYDQTVCDAWDEGGLGASKMQQVRQKLSNSQSGLTRWSARKFGNAERVLKEKTKKLELLQKEEGPSN
jgi:hypothetical protein